jgi:hypothetical protein
MSPDGDVARLRNTQVRALSAPISGSELDDGFPLLATNDHPHWTIVFAEPATAHVVRARRHFSQPVQNPVWVGRR